MTRLSSFLDELFETYHRPEYLSSDPLEFPHRFSDPLDQEAVGLLSALLAYGNVKQIRASVQQLLDRIAATGLTPRQFVAGTDFSERRHVFQGWVHRLNQGDDIALLLELLKGTWRTHGSLGARFVAQLDPGVPDFSKALNHLIEEWKGAAGDRGGPYFSHLLTAPSAGSCCKRWCMFLRWMGRSEKGRNRLDLGLWSPNGGLIPEGRGLSARQLILPLDTHTGRISQYLGLTHRKTLDWKAAVEVTDSLRKCDPEDPTRYDFALARLGILDLCQKTYRPEVCRSCPLLPACRFAAKEDSKRAKRNAKR